MDNNKKEDSKTTTDEIKKEKQEQEQAKSDKDKDTQVKAESTENALFKDPLLDSFYSEVLISSSILSPLSERSKWPLFIRSLSRKLSCQKKNYI